MRLALFFPQEINLDQEISGKKYVCHVVNKQNKNAVSITTIGIVFLLFFLTPLLLPACHNVISFVASLLAPLLYFLHLPYSLSC